VITQQRNWKLRLRQVVLARGVDSDEIDQSKLTPRMVSLLPDLVRHEFLMILKPVPNAVITEFVPTSFCLWFGQIRHARRKSKDATETCEFSTASQAVASGYGWKPD
jgi:hypothetical protein